MSYSMYGNLVRKYVWLIETIHSAGRISFKEINERWCKNVDLSGGEDLPLRTFNNWRDAIAEMFGLFIENEHCGDYRYYIENEDDITNNGLISWIYSTYCVGNALTGCQGIKDRILLEYVPSGQQYLKSIIDAMKENRVLNITYQSYWRDESNTFDVYPFCVKLFKQRWYLVAFSPYYEKVMIYALDRIFNIKKLDGETFNIPEDFEPEEFFQDYYGIIAGTGRKVESVKLKVSAGQANYFRSLPLHATQEEIDVDGEYSIFTLHICPEFDFQQEILSNGEDMEVLEPLWLREEIARIVNRLWNKYNKK